MEITAKQQERLNLLSKFGEQFTALKAAFLDLELIQTDNFRFTIQYLDDAFLRAREAIMFIPEELQATNSQEPANDSTTVADVDLKTAAAH